MPEPTSCTVYYDGDCPICQREIAFYRRRAGAEHVSWVDIESADGADLGPDLDKAQAKARLHVRLADGRLVSGARGFAALWLALPAFRWAGRIAASPPVAWPLERLYRAFLRVRPWLQRRFA